MMETSVLAELSKNTLLTRNMDVAHKLKEIYGIDETNNS